MNCQCSPRAVHALVEPMRRVRSGGAPTARERHAPSSSTDEADPFSFESHLPSWGSCLRLPRRFTGFLTTLATPLSSDPLEGRPCSIAERSLYSGKVLSHEAVPGEVDARRAGGSVGPAVKREGG